MSNKYSTSPALHLKIDTSSRRLVYTAQNILSSIFVFLVVLCAYLLFVKGHAWLAVLAIAGTLASTAHWLHTRNLFAAVEWREGAWFLVFAGDRSCPTQQTWVAVEPARHCVPLPGILYCTFLALEAGTLHPCWIPTRCFSEEQIRRLRVRLRLEGWL